MRTRLLDPNTMARGAQASAVIGSFLIGPATVGMIYAFMFDSNPGGKLDCASVTWHMGYDSREGCSVDIAERIRCGSGGASCFSLTKGAFGGFPPTLAAVIDGWVYAGTVITGSGVFHIFLALFVQGAMVGDGLLVVTSYLQVICFLSMVGTSSYGGNKIFMTVNAVTSVSTFTLFFICNSLMLWRHPKVWASQLAYFVYAINTLTMFFVVFSFLFVGFEYGPGKSCDVQYLAAGILSIAEQAFLLMYSLLILVMFNNSRRIDRKGWIELCPPFVGREEIEPCMGGEGVRAQSISGSNPPDPVQSVAAAEAAGAAEP